MELEGEVEDKTGSSNGSSDGNCDGKLGEIITGSFNRSRSCTNIGYFDGSVDWNGDGTIEMYSLG